MKESSQNGSNVKGDTSDTIKRYHYNKACYLTAIEYYRQNKTLEKVEEYSGEDMILSITFYAENGKTIRRKECYTVNNKLSLVLLYGPDGQETNTISYEYDDKFEKLQKVFYREVDSQGSALTKQDIYWEDGKTLKQENLYQKEMLYLEKLYRQNSSLEQENLYKIEKVDERTSKSHFELTLVEQKSYADSKKALSRKRQLETKQNGENRRDDSKKLCTVHTHTPKPEKLSRELLNLF